MGMRQDLLEAVPLEDAASIEEACKSAFGGEEGRGGGGGGTWYARMQGTPVALAKRATVHEDTVLAAAAAVVPEEGSIFMRGNEVITVSRLMLVVKGFVRVKEVDVTPICTTLVRNSRNGDRAELDL